MGWHCESDRTLADLLLRMERDDDEEARRVRDALAQEVARLRTAREAAERTSQRLRGERNTLREERDSARRDLGLPAARRGRPGAELGTPRGGRARPGSFGGNGGRRGQNLQRELRAPPATGNGYHYPLQTSGERRGALAKRGWGLAGCGGRGR
ncbi:hypothetical protein PVAP13_4KG076233 [Panicum virgatum]|uniref:Uncharacterized protein n=1 Tax=Panicum virgatum TaxID=38727 RepID=A0A8T0TDR3_PANVG|nr:hypothetical protein PVAP13_4KG076233 [Panicum virgatum]